MVVLKEVANMFWGITLDAGKRYTQTVETSFHISCAALEVAATADGPKQRAALMLQHEKVEFLLCTLDNKNLYQQTLDLNFTEGEEVCFFVNGHGVVHLSGYLVPEDTNDGEFGDYSADMGTSDDDDSDDEEDSDEEIPMLEELPEPRSSKRKKALEEAAPNKKRKKAPEPEEEDDEDSDEDPDFLEMDLDLADSDSDGSDDDDDDDEDEDDSDDDDEDDDDEDDDDEDDDDDSDEEEEEARNDLSGSFIQEKTKKAKTPIKDAQPIKAEKTPKSGKTPKQEQSPKSEKKVKAKQEENAKQKTPKAAKAAEAVATPNTEGKKKKKKQQGESPAPEAAAKVATPNTEGKKKKKKQEESPAPKAAANGATPNTEGKKKKKQQEAQENKQTPKKAKRVVLPGGTVVEDVKEGHGPEAKPGKMVHVYYKGTMKDGSVFDAVTSGKPFKFKLGKQEVIKGWDMGLQGMKVGSKRKLTVPPGQAYGSQRVGKIAANSTLFFDVELKAVS